MAASCRTCIASRAPRAAPHGNRSCGGAQSGSLPDRWDRVPKLDEWYAAEEVDRLLRRAGVGSTDVNYMPPNEQIK